MKGAAGPIRVRKTATKCVNKRIKKKKCTRSVHVCMCMYMLLGSGSLSLHLSSFQRKEKKGKKRALPGGGGAWGGVLYIVNFLFLLPSSNISNTIP